MTKKERLKTQSGPLGSGHSMRYVVFFFSFLLCSPNLGASDTPERKKAGLAMTAFISHPDYALHDPGAMHPERPDRVRAILSHLEKTDLLEKVLRITPEPADEKWIELIHPPGHVRRIERAAAEAPSALDPDTRLSSDSFRVAKLAVGGALTAVDAVMEGKVKNAFAAVRPPGHHALEARAMGFCLFNNVAIAARYLQKKYGLTRVLIVDWDVHHGNGTQDLFYADPSVLFFSTHQYPFYPGTGSAEETGAGEGKGLTINAPMPAMAGNQEVVRAFREKLVPAAESFQPEFVLISAGFDGHRRDPLAQLQLTEEGFADLTRIVMDIAEKHAEGRVVSLLEGGYDLEGLARSAEAHLRALGGVIAGRVHIQSLTCLLRTGRPTHVRIILKKSTVATLRQVRSDGSQKPLVSHHPLLVVQANRPIRLTRRQSGSPFRGRAG